MSQLQENISGIVAAFPTCAQNCSPLSREGLRQLMEQEFGDAMENPQDPETIQKVLCFLSEENNVRVDFRELLSLVFHVAKACYKPLQQHQELGDGPGLAGAGGQLVWPHSVGRESHSQQDPEHGVNKEDMEIQGQDNHQSQEGETPEQDQNTHQSQEGETPEQETHQIQEGETPEQETHQIQEGETPEQDQDTPQAGGTEAPEGNPERGEILDTATPEQDRNTCKAEEAEDTTKQDQNPHQAQESEAPEQGSNPHRSPEPEPAKQVLNSPSERGEDPKKAPWKDPNPSQTQEWGPNPQQDPKPQGTLWDPDCHQIPESKVLEMEQLQGPPVVGQQLLQPLCQWPPEQ